MTLIGTPPNLLIAESLVLNGYEPFELFDFTPIGGAVMLVGVLFVALGGRFLLPKMKAARDKHVSQRSLRARYKLQERTFMLRVPTDSILVGKTLAESRIGSSTGLIILSLLRAGRSETLPGRQTVLRGGDGILVQGRVDQFRELHRLSDLVEAELVHLLLEKIDHRFERTARCGRAVSRLDGALRASRGSAGRTIAGGELGQGPGVEAAAEGEDKIRVPQGVVGRDTAVHARHAEEPGCVERHGAERVERGRDRDLEALGEGLQRGVARGVSQQIIDAR